MWPGGMARFRGARQGLAVWLWGIVMAVIIAGIAWIAGSQYDVVARLDLPRIPVNEGDVTAVGLIAIGAALLTGLIGALLGDLAGMRFTARWMPRTLMCRPAAPDRHHPTVSLVAPPPTASLEAAAGTAAQTHLTANGCHRLSGWRLRKSPVDQRVWPFEVVV